MGKQSRLRAERRLTVIENGRERQITIDAEGGIGYEFHDPAREHVMNWGCRGCHHFDNGEAAIVEWIPQRQRYFDVQLPQLMAREPRLTVEEAAKKTAGIVQRRDAMMAPPRGGLCRKHGTWTLLESSCEQYSAKFQADGPLTALPEEVKARLDGED